MIQPLLRRFRGVRGLEDRGALLIIAIAIVTVVALVTGFVLTRGDGSLRATVQLRDVARASYAADAAAQVAINDLRTGYNTGTGEPDPWYYTNETGTGCFGYDGSGAATTPKDTLTLDGLVPKVSGDTQSVMSAAVTCTPEDATGAQGSAVPINNANKPGNAILTLGTSGAENGFTFKTNGADGAFRVRGGVWSNSNIVRDQTGSLESTEYIRAATGCSPVSAMDAPVVNCSASTVADPNYQSDLDLAGAGIPDLQIPPASCPSGGSVTLSPGYYDDVTKLNALTDTNTECTIFMDPGTYYFDFHNNSADTLFDADIASNDGDVWTIGSRKTLVAGTRDNSDTTVPGRCISPIEDVNAAGVQLIFGGDSRMSVAGSGQDTAVEICGTYHASRPPIAVYGQKTGTTPSATVLSGASSLKASGSVTTSATVGTFAPAGSFSSSVVQDAGNGQVTWTRDSTGANNYQTGTVTMTGFTPSTAIEKGAVLTGARLVVRHQEGSTTNAANASEITFQPTGSATTLSSTLPLRTSTLTDDTQDLSTATGWGTVQKYVHDNGFTGGTVQFRTKLPRAAAATTVQAILDSVQLELTYYVPQLRGQTTAAISGNTVATPGGAPVVQASGNSTSLYIQGTTYTPLAKIDLSLNNIDESVFRFGVIARSLVVFETGSFSFPGAVIELPDNSPGFGFETTIVQLKVYLCPGLASGCTSSNGELALTSRVKIFDDGGTAGPPHRQMSVLSWSHTR
jgi:Tfp pilus assembly protein PilX